MLFCLNPERATQIWGSISRIASRRYQSDACIFQPLGRPLPCVRMSRSAKRRSRAVVVTMVQERDFPAALTSLESIERARGGVPHLILWNDRSDSGRMSALASLGATVIDAGENLGVAAGRNLLFRTAIDMGADWIVALDDDILVPSDYLDRAMRHVRRMSRSDERFGLLAPAVLGIPALVETGMVSPGLEGWVPILKSTRRLRGFLRSSLDKQIPASIVDYMGIRDWERHYLSAHGQRASAARRLCMGSAHGRASVNGAVRSDPVARYQILDPQDPIPVDTVPGGVAILSSRMLKHIGLLDETMGTFGYEDAELCIRAHLRGYRAYVVPDMPILHDIQWRGRERQVTSIYEARNGHRALILDRHATPQLVGEWFFELFVLGIPEAVDAISRHTGDDELDLAGRLYLRACAAFLDRWHAVSTADRSHAVPANTSGDSAMGAWSVRTVVSGGIVETRVEIKGAPDAGLVEASIRLSSEGPEDGPSSVAWAISAQTRQGSTVSLDIRLERDRVADWGLASMEADVKLGGKDALVLSDAGWPHLSVSGLEHHLSLHEDPPRRVDGFALSELR